MKKKICVFTDSRGEFKLDPSMTMFHEELGEAYEVTRFTQPHKWTTILDFLMLVRDGTIIPTSFDYVVLWAGVVDFSPRPFRSCYRDLLGGLNRNQVAVTADRTKYYARTINRKIDAIDRMLRNRHVDNDYNLSNLEWALCPPYAVNYAGEPTASMYSKEFLNKIASELNAIPNLIFIDTCGIHAEWDGNFAKGRPRNVNEIVRYNNLLTQQLNCPIIRQSDWSEEEIVERTIDSMHINQAGADAIRQELVDIIESDRHAEATRAGNFLLTACDRNFFATTLAMIETAFEHSSASVDGIAVLDIGMDVKQRELLENLKGVYVFDYNEDDKSELQKLNFNFFDPKTYGFKVYLTVRAPFLIRERLGIFGKLRLLYVDGGILINKDMSEIFRKIDEDGIFCVDHDECRDLYGFRTFLLNILSPRLIEDGVFEQLENEQLALPYIKAGFFGYEPGGKYQIVIDELWDLCRNSSVLTLPKSGSDESERDWFRNHTDIERYTAENFGSNERLILDYVGSRQDQTALSYIVAKHRAPISNSREFNYTVSTGSARTGWNQIVKRLSSKYPECDVDPNMFWEKHNSSDNRKTPAKLIPIPHEARSALTILHRGALVDEDMMKEAGRLLNRASNINNDTFILLGNGPSLGDVDLKSLQPYSTFGLNAAYRAYERIGFWPTYFGCFDAVVCGNHAEKFKALIKDSPIEKFFFINYNENKKPNFPEDEIQSSPKFTNINFVERTVPEKERSDIIATSFDPFIDMLTSGSNAVQCALLMGYRKIILLGCDANYVEVVEGASHESNRNRLKMDKTPDSNPNYWFDDYQQEGDRFNVPNTQGCQLPAWTRLADTIGDLGINAEIINCSPISKIDVFKKMPLEEALAYFDKLNIAQDGLENRPARRTRPLSVSTKPKPEKLAADKKVGANSSEGGSLYADSAPGPAEMIAAASNPPAPPAPVAKAPSQVPTQPAIQAKAPTLPPSQPAAKLPPARAPRMGKLRRDPHLFFKDSKVAPLRLLRHFFKPTGITRAQAEALQKLKLANGGFWSWLPVSRLAVARMLHDSEMRAVQAQSASISALHTQVAKLEAEMRAAQAQSASMSALHTQVAKLEAEIATLNFRTTASLQDQLASMRNQISSARTELQMLNAEQSERSSEFSNLLADIARRQGEAENAIDMAGKELSSRLVTEITSMKATLQEDTSADKQRDQRLTDTEQNLSTIKSDITSFKADRQLSYMGNGPIWRLHGRTMSREDIAHLRTHWLKPLGLFLSEQQVGYLAYRLALAEDRCEGRLATTIQASVIRAAALLSLQSDNIELLEIGTLFGIAAGSLHQTGRRAKKSVNLTLIDPLDGYYGQNARDNSTWVPVSRETLEYNLRALDVPENQYRIIQALSSSDEAISQASDRQYDYILIDGDHSLEGVAADFELYGPMVKPGGVLIFDDYGTKDWPVIQKYVDDHVRGLDDWLWIGGEWRTGVFRRKRKPVAK